jgi:hypothetical protein
MSPAMASGRSRTFNGSPSAKLTKAPLSVPVTLRTCGGLSVKSRRQELTLDAQARYPDPILEGEGLEYGRYAWNN